LVNPGFTVFSRYFQGSNIRKKIKEWQAVFSTRISLSKIFIADLPKLEESSRTAIEIVIAAIPWFSLRPARKFDTGPGSV